MLMYNRIDTTKIRKKYQIPPIFSVIEQQRTEFNPVP